MSIVTLKRKTQTQYKNMSANKPHFSLNGTLRNQGYVGQTSLSRTLLKTPMRGNVPCGHGGCCGTFKNQLILSVNPIAVTLNNSNVIKPSVINTLGMIDTKYKWANRPQPYSTVKPDNNQNINRQSDYITNLSKSTVAAISILDSSGTTVKTCKKCVNLDIFSGSTHNNNNLHTKPVSDYVPISQGEYLLQMQNNCTPNDTTYVPKAVRGTPFSGFKAN
jgi:hypothetical protein